MEKSSARPTSGSLARWASSSSKPRSPARASAAAAGPARSTPGPRSLSGTPPEATRWAAGRAGRPTRLREQSDQVGGPPGRSPPGRRPRGQATLPCGRNSTRPPPGPSGPTPPQRCSVSRRDPTQAPAERGERASSGALRPAPPPREPLVRGPARASRCAPPNADEPHGALLDGALGRWRRTLQQYLRPMSSPHLGADEKAAIAVSSASVSLLCTTMEPHLSTTVAVEGIGPSARPWPR